MKSSFATSVTIHKDPEKERLRLAAIEIKGLQAGFAALRAAGGCQSEYPQQAFSRILGVTVREVREHPWARVA